MALCYKSCDNARTPMQWSDAPCAGFTTGTPWLQVNPNYVSINAASQLHDRDSVFFWYKQLIALRKNPDYKETIVYGRMLPYLREQKNLMAFFRKSEQQTLLILANYQKEPQDVCLPADQFRILANNYPQLNLNGNVAQLQGYQAVVLELL